MKRVLIALFPLFSPFCWAQENLLSKVTIQTIEACAKKKPTCTLSEMYRGITITVIPKGGGDCMTDGSCKNEIPGLLITDPTLVFKTDTLSWVPVEYSATTDAQTVAGYIGLTDKKMAKMLNFPFKYSMSGKGTINDAMVITFLVK